MNTFSGLLVTVSMPEEPEREGVCVCVCVRERESVCVVRETGKVVQLLF